MRHHNKQRKLGRVRNQRTALVRSLARSLILHGAIETTEARAKELRPFVEKLVTKGKRGTLVSQRLLAAELSNSREAIRKLVGVLAPRYQSRAGGYTRITKLPSKREDAAPMARIEFV